MVGSSAGTLCHPRRFLTDAFHGSLQALHSVVGISYGTLLLLYGANHISSRLSHLGGNLGSLAGRSGELLRSCSQLLGAVMDFTHELVHLRAHLVKSRIHLAQLIATAQQRLVAEIALAHVAAVINHLADAGDDFADDEEGHKSQESEANQGNHGHEPQVGRHGGGNFLIQLVCIVIGNLLQGSEVLQQVLGYPGLYTLVVIPGSLGFALVCQALCLKNTFFVFLPVGLGLSYIISCLRHPGAQVSVGRPFLLEAVHSIVDGGL